VRVIGWVLVLVLGAAAVLTLNPEWLASVDPDWGGLTMSYPLAQLFALRALLAVIFAVVAAVVLVVGAVRRRWFHGGTRTLLLGVVLALVAGAHGWVLVERGLSNPAELAADRGLRPADPGDGTLTVVAYNTREGRTGADDVAATAEDTGADVLVLSETSAELAQEIASLLAGEDETFQVFMATGGPEGVGDTGSTAMLVSTTLGEYAQVPGPATERGAVRAEPASGVGPVLVGVHAMPPLGETHGQWLVDIEAVMDLCGTRGPDGMILAGDLNTTLDHAAMQDLGRCADGAVEAGVGGLATWPAQLPAVLGTSIDHVLVDAARYEVTAGRIVDRGDSDHRGLVVRVRPVGP
jgi:endonuclease/exonuclease/phosphatase (EEP) superfamily protein YafD